ncbi:iron-containing alcohol dehydrogenase, partial [Luminiphilus sp.]|nr:iron-containing alcohol dehydrogenase [Luminiphilus sp.]
MTTEPVDWNFPTQMAVGPGRIAELPEFCQQQGIRAPLIVTDPGLAALPMVAAIKTACDDAGMTSGVFADVQGNPTLENVEAGVIAFHAGDHDGVVALGGGSALDAGKAIAFASGQNRPLWDFVDVEDGWMLAKSEGIAPIIAVPTTAGTGSEVGRISVITDSAQHQKRLVFHPQIQPSVVILDPEL